MENNKHLDELDGLIRASMEISDVPSAQLNARLKSNLYKQAAIMKQQKPTRSISLWYVPMLLNLFTFTLLAVVSPLVISNPYLAKFSVLLCAYIAIAGVVITVVGVKRANMKKSITIHIEKKRGALA